MNNYEKRLLEIRYYFFVQDMITETGNVTNMLDLITLLAKFNAINKQALSKITLDIISSPRFRPTYEELIICAMEARETKKREAKGNRGLLASIAKKYGMSWKVQKNIWERDKYDPRVYYPKLNHEELEEILNFYHTLKHLKGLGI